jgi:N-carbamoylputrescine amidase
MSNSLVTLAAVQMAMSADAEANQAKASDFVRLAAMAGAQVVLLPELFAGEYFCKDMLDEHFALAHPAEGHPLLAGMAALAREFEVVLPVSFFERDGDDYYNSCMVYDADGASLGLYRKSHIPHGPGYEEKYYFKPGDTGFKVFESRYGRIGVGICWDQWFPECARSLALMGADMLLYPTAIGSEPEVPGYSTRDHWRAVMVGHAGANLLPLVAANRVGAEQGVSCEITFYGSSFIASPLTDIVAQADEKEETVLTATFDLNAVRALRNEWSLFGDRRPELYGALCKPVV